MIVCVGGLVCISLHFFFKKKTAYEIYQCDWSSDVCSSDLVRDRGLIWALPQRFLSPPPTLQQSPLEQDDAQPVLKQVHQPADSGRRDVQLSSGTGEGGVARGGLERLEAIQGG